MAEVARHRALSRQLSFTSWLEKVPLSQAVWWTSGPASESQGVLFARAGLVIGMRSEWLSAPSADLFYLGIAAAVLAWWQAGIAQQSGLDDRPRFADPQSLCRSITSSSPPTCSLWRLGSGNPSRRVCWSAMWPHGLSRASPSSTPSRSICGSASRRWPGVDRAEMPEQRLVHHRFTLHPRMPQEKQLREPGKALTIGPDGVDLAPCGRPVAQLRSEYPPCRRIARSALLVYLCVSFIERPSFRLACTVLGSTRVSLIASSKQPFRTLSVLAVRFSSESVCELTV
jgi:hypothetical protein